MPDKIDTKIIMSGIKTGSNVLNSDNYTIGSGVISFNGYEVKIIKLK